MKIYLTSSNFTNVEGVYYSPAFKQDINDSVITVAVWTEAPATASMQSSINGTDWVDVTNTSFSVNTAGLQTFVDCHYGLVHRIKIDALPTNAQILI